MTSTDKGPNLGRFEDPTLPRTAYRRVPKPGFLNRFLHRTTLEPLPQHYPEEDRRTGKIFDFAYLISTGAIKEDRQAESMPATHLEANSALITDQAGAIALRRAAEEAHRTDNPTPPQSLS